MDMKGKINALIGKLRESDYDLFDGNKDEAMDFLESKLTAFPHYANVVIQEQIMQPIWRARYDGQQLQDKVMEIDQKRRIKHESAIAAVSILNRVSKSFGLEPFADIDVTDRHQVAEFTGAFISEMYNNGIGHTFNDATYGKDVEYKDQRVHDELAALDRNYDAIKTNMEGSDPAYAL